jgi:hypothetical protein
LRLADVDESVPGCKQDDLKPGFESKLPKNVCYVDAHGLAGDAQPVCHLFVAQAFGKNLDYFHFSGRQLIERRLRVAFFLPMITDPSKHLNDLARGQERFSPV